MSHIASAIGVAPCSISSWCEGAAPSPAYATKLAGLGIAPEAWRVRLPAPLIYRFRWSAAWGRFLTPEEVAADAEGEALAARRRGQHPGSYLAALAALAVAHLGAALLRAGAVGLDVMRETADAVDTVRALRRGLEREGGGYAADHSAAVAEVRRRCGGGRRAGSRANVAPEMPAAYRQRSENRKRRQRARAEAWAERPRA